MNLIKSTFILLFSSVIVSGCIKNKVNIEEVIENELSAVSELHANEVPYGALRKNADLLEVWLKPGFYQSELEKIYFESGLDFSSRVSAFLLLQCLSDDEYLGLYARVLINLDDDFSAAQKQVLLLGGGAAWGARPHILYQRNKEFRKVVDRSANINRSELIKKYLKTISSSDSLSFLESIGINYCPQESRGQ